MTKHNWLPAPIGYEPDWKELQENINTSSRSVIVREHGVYTCSRCGEDARVYKGHFVSKNWDSDCDQVIIQKVHDS